MIIFLVPTISWIIALNITPIYESRARLLIEAKDLGVEENGAANLFKSISKSGNPIQTQIEILKSSTILEKVIHQFNLRYKKGPQKGQYLSYTKLSQNLSVSADKNVDIVELKYKDPDPKKAKDIVQAITDSYIDKTIELKASNTASAIRFLKKERNKAEREMLDSSKRLREFEQRSKIVGFDANQELIKAVYSLKSLRLSIDTEYVRTKSASEQISRQLMSNIDDVVLENTVNQDPFLAALKKDLFDRQTQLVKLQTKVKPGHYQLEEIKQQIEGDNKLISERIKDLLGKEVDPKSFPYSQDPLRMDLTKSLLQAKTVELATEQQLIVVDNAIAELQKKS